MTYGILIDIEDIINSGVNLLGAKHSDVNNSDIVFASQARSAKRSEIIQITGEFCIAY